MIRVIYVSSEAHQFDEKSLDDLLAISRKNNEGQQITGMLLYRDGDFLQVLEGDENDVKLTCKRIFKDDRHSTIIELDQTEITERDFSDWSMGFKRLQKQDVPDGFVDFFDRSFEESSLNLRGEEALQFLRSFKKLGA